MMTPSTLFHQIRDTTFWLPEVFLYGVLRTELPRGLITITLPVSLLGTYLLVLWFHRVHDVRPSAAIHMLLGVWFTGPLAMMIGATFLGAGFRQPGVAVAVVVMGTVVPIYTLIASVYDGSAGALLGASILLPVMHLLFERKTWIIRRPRL